MNEHEYYDKFFGYMHEDGYYRHHAHLWDGKELFEDLKSLFKNKPAADVTELNSFHVFYKRMYDPHRYDSGYLVPILFLKKEDSPVYVLLQDGTFIFMDDTVLGVEISIATPGRGSGYIECSLKMKDGKKTPLPLFSEATSLSRDADKHVHALKQIKVLADFLHVPLKLEMFVDA